MSLDLQELVALAIVVAIVVLNLWLRRRRKADATERAADCAGCPKSAAEPAAAPPRLVQLGGRSDGGRARTPPPGRAP